MPVQYARVEELPTAYAHIYLSPHLDDAALSCGGGLARAVSAGQPALVVNICGGSPPPGGPFSPFATFQHERWGLPAEEAVARRQAEDAAALAILGADSLDLGVLDAIYRLPEAYADDETLFGPVAPDDTLADAIAPALRALAARCPGAIFYAPLAVGGHVDHQAVHAAADALAHAGIPVAFYEDLPYATVDGAVDARLAAVGATAFAPVAVDIGGTIERKLSAVAAYASQLGTLFGGEDQMRQALSQHARMVAPSGAAFGERLWARQ